MGGITTKFINGFRLFFLSGDFALRFKRNSLHAFLTSQVSQAGGVDVKCI